MKDEEIRKIAAELLETTRAIQATLALIADQLTVQNEILAGISFQSGSLNVRIKQQ